MLTDDVPGSVSGSIRPDELRSEVSARLEYKQSTLGDGESYEIDCWYQSVGTGVTGAGVPPDPGTR
jgi:hypothetical protein